MKKALSLTVMGCLSASVILAQGLGDAARKAEENRKKSRDAGVKVRTIGDAELQAAGDGKGTFSTPSGAAADTESATARPAGEESSPRSEGTRKGGREGSPLSDFDKLEAKAAFWRTQYHAVKSAVDALEREVAELEKKAAMIRPGGGIPGARVWTGTGPYGPSATGNVVSEADAVSRRLPKAREELARLRQDLSAIEDGARRDGVGSGQLY